MNRNSAAISGALLILGIGSLLTGAFAFLAPTAFFETFAAYTGEPNLHLMRDVGAAYLAAGAALTWAVFIPRWRPPLTSIAAIFLVLHALAHLFDLASGEVPWSHLLADLAQVLLPAAIVCGLAVYFLNDRSDDLPPSAPAA
jgi:hypothetical protein